MLKLYMRLELIYTGKIAFAEDANLMVADDLFVGPFCVRSSK